MEETKYSQQEVQKDVSNYQFTLLSGEIIELNCIRDEDIDEGRDNSIFIELESATYNHRLYVAFKNKELVQFIKKESTNVKITDATIIHRTFTYDSYFKIEEFRTQYEFDSVPYYRITFKSI